MNLAELKRNSVPDLLTIAGTFDVDKAKDLAKQDLILAILRAQSDRSGDIHAEGVLEILPDGFGFLRAADSNYLPGPDDIYVSPSQIRRFDLRTGDTVGGLIRPPKESERYFALLKVEHVNHRSPDGSDAPLSFDDHTPIYPTEQLRLEHDPKCLSTRIVDLVCPIGKGQRCLVVAPPGAGKTRLLEVVAHAIHHNYPEVVVLFLLIDERPEEVTDIQRSIEGEVIASTFDEPPSRHVQVSEIVVEKAKRLAEVGKDVVILLDSLTSLTRAYNATVQPSGRDLAEGLDAGALSRPKRFFGAARNLEGSGSVTIIATVLVDTGSRMDEVIFEELRSTGNCEIYLDRVLMEKRQFPCVDVAKSRTRKEERMMESARLGQLHNLRRSLGVDASKAIEALMVKLNAEPTNEAVLSGLD